MKNPDFYIQYTDYGYIEDERPKGFSFASCLAFGMIIVILFSVFALGAVFKSTYTNLIEMDTIVITVSTSCGMVEWGVCGETYFFYEFGHGMVGVETEYVENDLFSIVIVNGKNVVAYT